MPKKYDLRRLGLAMERSRLVLRKYREERARLVKQYVGSHYSEDAVRSKVPINILKLYAKVVGSKLISNNLRFMLSTFATQNKPAVSAMEAWMNHEIQKMGLTGTLERVILDAILGYVGITKVALAAPTNAAVYGWNLKAGNPFAERVSLDDFVYDVHARDFAEVSFIGHRYRVPMDSVQRSTLYNRRIRSHLAASPDALFNREGDERLNVLGRTTLAGSFEDEYLEHVDLWEIFLPHEQQIITFPDESSQGQFEGFDSQEPLRVQPWIGPPSAGHKIGPYHLLTMNIVPDNPMGMGPGFDILDLHEGINENFRKLMRQSSREKIITGFMAGNDGDAARVSKADDGDLVRVDRPETMQTIKHGGPSPDLLQFTLAMKELTSWLAGNLDIMGGLSPQSKTASQDQLLAQNASSNIQDMQAKTVEYVSGIGRSLGWFWWYHPTGVMMTHKKLPGLPDTAIQRQVYPRGATMPNGMAYPLRRDARFEDLDIMVDPYSMEHSSPQANWQKLQAMMTTVIIPMMPFLQQQGIYVDMNSYLRKAERYNNLPDLSDIISIAEPPQQQGDLGPSDSEQETPKPAQTQRNYVRENVSGRTEQGTNAALRSALLGVNPGGNRESSRNGKMVGAR